MEIILDRERILDRFLRYVAVDTRSDDSSLSFPSTPCQFNLARLLRDELQTMGLQDVKLDENGYLTALLPSNISAVKPVVGFISHMDTSPDMSGTNVKPKVIPNYDGKDVVLNDALGITLSVSDFPELARYAGQTLICTDGTTLLGGDDKAGITEIVSAMEFLIAHPEIPHGGIRIGFTPDEEIGKGVDKFDVQGFGADFAYTMDGGAIGELEYENFNAASAKIAIQGRNIHPGYAKGKMVNALLVAMELNAMLPANDRPEYTADYEGFYHLVRVDGTVEKAMIQYIIRDHDRALFEGRKEMIRKVVDFINAKYRPGTVELDLKDQYYNMKEMILPVYHVVETAMRAMEQSGVNPHVMPIRGGTDGARLSYMGLPCPNIFAGGHNFHGKFEYVPLESILKATEVVVRIARLVGEG